MKVVFASLTVAVCAGLVAAQQVPDPPKVVAAITASSSAVKGQPFSAEAVSESVQTLADGNRIVQSSTSKLYRNSEGKVRREMTGGTGGMRTFFNFEPGISIMEPSGARVLLDQHERTVRSLTAISPEALKIREGQMTQEQKKAVEELRVLRTAPDGQELNDGQKRAVEVLRSTGVVTSTAPVPPTAIARGFGTPEMGGNFMISTADGQKWDTKTDDLGTQNIEGLLAEGSRRTTVIPAGAIGNERPIEIVYERWYSKELGMVLMSKHSDPRFGEQTYTLKNIVRAEPDPSLFTVPQGFKVIAPDAPGQVYTVRSTVKTPAPAQAPKQQ